MRFRDFLIEKGKISHDMIEQALNNPNITFGFEAEFVLAGIDEYMTENTLSGAQNGPSGYTKKVSALTYDDLLRYFLPLNVPTRDRGSNPGVLIYRLKMLVEEPERARGRTAFEAAKQKYGIWKILLGIEAFPAMGFAIPERGNAEIKNAILKQDRAIAARMLALNFRLFYMTDHGGTKPITDEVIKNLKRNKAFSLTQDIYLNPFLERMARMIRTRLGPTAFTSRPKSNQAVSKNYTRWLLTTDSTIEADYISTMGVELVSPVSTLKNGFDNLQNAFSLISDFPSHLVQGYTNDSTGLHINIGVRNSREIDYLKLIFLLGEEHLLKQFGRLDSEMAQEVLLKIANQFSVIRARSSFNPQTIEFIPQREIDAVFNLDRNKIHLIKSALMRAMSIGSEGVELDKYQSVNLRKALPDPKRENDVPPGFVEFRIIGGKDYHKRFGEIRPIIFKYAVLMLARADPNMFKKEYYSKLYSYLKNVIPYAEPKQKIPDPIRPQIEALMSNPLVGEFLNTTKSGEIVIPMTDIIHWINSYKLGKPKEIWKLKSAITRLIRTVEFVFQRSPMNPEQKPNWEKIKQNLTAILNAVQPQARAA